MNHKEFIIFLDSIFKAIGFHKKGSTWYKKLVELTQIVKPQKSNFGNYYYLEYGYIINRVQLEGLDMHIFKRLASNDKEENRKIGEILNFENNYSEEQRKKEIQNYISRFIIQEFEKINSENELKAYLTSSGLPTIPLAVRNYFSIK